MYLPIKKITAIPSVNIINILSKCVPIIFGFSAQTQIKLYFKLKLLNLYSSTFSKKSSPYKLQ